MHRDKVSLIYKVNDCQGRGGITGWPYWNDFVSGDRDDHIGTTHKESLIIEFSAVDGLSSCACAMSKVSSLDHELFIPIAEEQL